MSRTCEVCGNDTTRDAGRCTNNRCSTCHRLYCTPGGDTEPGHGRRWPAPRVRATMNDNRPARLWRGTTQKGNDHGNR